MEEAPSHPSNIGRYRVLSRIGSGRMGVVYSAYDPHLDRRVALKVVERDLVELVLRRSKPMTLSAAGFVCALTAALRPEGFDMRLRIGIRLGIVPVILAIGPQRGSGVGRVQLQ